MSKLHVLYVLQLSIFENVFEYCSKLYPKLYWSYFKCRCSDTSLSPPLLRACGRGNRSQAGGPDSESG